MAQVATLVSGTTGVVRLVPYADPGVLDRLAAMERIGTWPS